MYTRHYLTASSLTGRENTHPDHPSAVPIFAGSCNLANPRVNSWMCLRYVAFCLRLLKWKHGGDLFEDTESREIDLNNIFSLCLSSQNSSFSCSFSLFPVFSALPFSVFVVFLFSFSILSFSVFRLLFFDLLIKFSFALSVSLPSIVPFHVFNLFPLFFFCPSCPYPFSFLVAIHLYFLFILVICVFLSASATECYAYNEEKCRQFS